MKKHTLSIDDNDKRYEQVIEDMENAYWNELDRIEELQEKLNQTLKEELYNMPIDDSIDK